MRNTESTNVRQRKAWWRRLLTWALWPIGVVSVLLAAQITLLAFPQLIMSECARAGTIVIYCDAPGDDDLSHLAAEVDRRLQATELYDPSRTDRVFFFQNSARYRLFARLSMVTPLAQGFNLSIFGNSFVSATRVAELRRRSGGVPRYSIWEGDPAHTIAHEVAHQHVVDHFGRGRWRSLPHWKQEGIIEYLANVGAISQDTLATLASRIDVLRNDALWRGQRDWDRVHYEAGLLVEFLTEVETLRLEDILATSITRDEALATMINWRHARR